MLLLEPPSYGFEREGKLYFPGAREIVAEFFARLNVARDRRCWLNVVNVLTHWGLVVPLVLALTHYASWTHLSALLGYIVFLNVYGTCFLHRYGAHRAFRFTGSFSRFVVRNLAVKVMIEELFTVSHIVHHQAPEKAGDPYSAHGGWLYSFLSDVNHQPVRRGLSRSEYRRLRNLVGHQGVRCNTHAGYLRWGSIANPLRTIAHYALNWAFWGFVFYSLGGIGLVCAIWGACFVWGAGLRNFNYKAHGKGRSVHRAGIDFHHRDLSVNLVFPGFSAGEWHNNHHLFPSSARAGFLPWQPDISFLFVRVLHLLGLVASFHDDRERFLKERYLPYLQARAACENVYPA